MDEAECEDERWIVVDGRKWRATDPNIPEPFRQELVNELMRARRAIGAAKKAGDEDRVEAQRAYVQAAKVALGERGEPWWEPPSPDGQRHRLEAAVLALSAHRGPDKTICPSDAARAVGGEGWRSLMDTAREVARDLAREGTIEVTQKGAALDPDVPWRGPVRIRRLAT